MSLKWRDCGTPISDWKHGEHLVSVLRSLALVTSQQADSSRNRSVIFPGLLLVMITSKLCSRSVIFCPRRYKSATFQAQLLDILHALRAPTWTNPLIVPDRIEIQKVSGSMTNAVFFVSCPSVPETRILLLRIYGPSSGAMISRPRELQILHVLSSQYRIGPRVYGTFENGRIEEYFDAITLTAADLRDKRISSWIGARMAELHSVDIQAVEMLSSGQTDDDRDWIAVMKNVESWLRLARDVLALPSAPEALRIALDLNRFEVEWEKYVQWLREKGKTDGASTRVFAHNDTQYGNLLRLKDRKEGMPEHHQIIVVDFEYASPNPAAFDIANHFHEWTANYHSDTPHILDPALWPTLEHRRNFYYSYSRHLASSADPAVELSDEDLQAHVERLDSQVRAWSPSSHAMWALWGIVQAREIVEGKDGEPEFDYLGYSECRLEGFRREIRELGFL